MGVHQLGKTATRTEVAAGTPEWRHPQRPPSSGQSMSGVVFGCNVEAGSGLDRFLDDEANGQPVLDDQGDHGAIRQPVEMAEQISDGAL